MRPLCRLLIVCVTILALATPSSANPLSKTWHWAGTHKRFLIMEGVAVGAAGLHAYGMHKCRSINGVEPCQSHYGAAWATYGFVTGITVIAMPAVAEGCWKNEGGKFCYALAYGGSAYQAGWGIYQSRIRQPHEVEFRSPAPSLLKLRF